MPAPSLPDELVHLKVNTAQLSAEQDRFNKLIERVASLTRQTETHRGWAERYIPLRTNTVASLYKQRDALTRALVLFLHQWLGGADLGAAQRRMASRLVCRWSASFAASGDADMQTLHDTYSEQSFAQNQNQAASVTLAMQHLRERDQAEQAQRAARKAKRPKTARQEEAHLKDQDANSALKTIYRQLASALHPDREADPEAHKLKTALMGEANAAYERRDLLALLQLQLRIEQVDSVSIGRMAHSRLVALSRLLSEQSKALSQDLLTLQLRLFDAFSLHPGTRVSEARIVGSIEEERQALQAAIDHLEADTARVQDPAQLKRWLKEQQSRSQDAD